MRMTLSKKGLLFLLLPLLVQLGCFLMYHDIVRQAVHLYQKQMRNKEVVGHLNWLGVLSTLSALTANGYAISGDKELLNTYVMLNGQTEAELKENNRLFEDSGHGKIIRI